MVLDRCVQWEVFRKFEEDCKMGITDLESAESKTGVLEPTTKVEDGEKEWH